MLLMGISYMFNAGDRQVFPALLVAIRKEYGLSLPEAGFVSKLSADGKQLLFSNFVPLAGGQLERICPCRPGAGERPDRRPLL